MIIEDMGILDGFITRQIDTALAKLPVPPAGYHYVPKVGDIVYDPNNNSWNYDIKFNLEANESEDERIRKELIKQVEKSKHHPADKERWISWLEKQKEEQKPAEWSEEDEKIAKEIEEELWYPGDFPDYPSKEESELYDDCQRRLNWFKKRIKSLHPHWKPSEEQMKALYAAIYIDEIGLYGGLKDWLLSLYDDLKKLSDGTR